MKKLGMVFLVACLSILNGCTQKPDVNALLQKEETRNAIFKAIEDNKDFMTAFMGEMQSNENAMKMMQGNRKMMRSMMHGEGMPMMMKDTIMMKNMREQMMGNKNMMRSMMHQMMADSTNMGKMMQMMHQNGMMSNDCMQSCMKMMSKNKMKM